MPILNKDMTLCISLAGRPSNIGTRFHNWLYEEYGLNWIYKAFSTADLAGAIAGVRALGIRGCSVSMPFKQQALGLVDHVNRSAAVIDAVNTIVNDDGVLTAWNTDYVAVTSLLADKGVGEGWSVALRGSGGMARAVAAALADAGVRDVVVIARNRESGRRLAGEHGFAWEPELGTEPRDLLINATPLGMDGPEAMVQSFSPDAVEAARIVFDVVALPAETPLIRAARSAGKPVITGAEVIALQAAEQFHLYTGIRPSDEAVRKASAFSRGEPVE